MKKIIVLEGNIAQRKKALDDFKSSLGDYELFVFDKQDRYEYVSQIVTEISCFGQNKLFIIKELPTVDAPTNAQARTKVLNYFKKLFPSIPYGNNIVFDNVGLSAESFFKEVRKYGEVHKFDQKINKSDAKKVVSRYFKNKNIITDSEVTSLVADLLNLNGNDVDVDKLHLMIKKIYNYVYGKKQIVKQDIYKVCSSSKDFIIWTFYNMLDDVSISKEKNIGPIVGLIADYLNNAKYFNYEASFLIKGMIWRYGLLLMTKNDVNNRISQKDIISKISNINKLESSGNKYRMILQPKMKSEEVVPEYSSKMINSIMGSYGRAALTCYTFDQLLLIYYTLVKTSIKIRAGCTESEIMISIYLIVLVVCGLLTKRNTIDGMLEYKKILYGMGK